MGKRTQIIIKDLKGSAEKLAIDLILSINANLLATNPVLTGFSRSNWLLSVATPIRSTAGTLLSIDTSAQEAGIGQILRWKFEQGSAYLVNNVDYIGKLNAGSSAKAPAMFVEMAIAKGITEAINRVIG